MAEYEAELGNDDKALNQHIATINALVQYLIEKGCNRRVQINWDAVATVRLQMVESKNMVVQKPGYRHFPLQEYSIDFPEGLAHYEKEGHRAYCLKGIDGVLVPDRQITKINFDEVTSIESRKDLMKDVIEQAGLTDEQVNANMDNFAGGFFNGLSNFSSSSMARPLAPLVAPSAVAPSAVAPAASVSEDGAATPKAKAKAKVLPKMSLGGCKAKDGGVSKDSRGRKPRDLDAELAAITTEI